MAHRISAAEFEALYLSNSGVGLVDAHADHVPRVAQILSEANPGIVFLWWWAGKGRIHTICAVRPDRRALSTKTEEKLVGAAEAIARNVARKHRGGFLKWLFRRTLKPGWHYTPKK